MRRPNMMVEFEGCVARVGACKDASSANDGQVDQWVVDLEIIRAQSQLPEEALRDERSISHH